MKTNRFHWCVRHKTQHSNAAYLQWRDTLHLSIKRSRVRTKSRRKNQAPRISLLIRARCPTTGFLRLPHKARENKDPGGKLRLFTTLLRRFCDFRSERNIRIVRKFLRKRSIYLKIDSVFFCGRSKCLRKTVYVKTTI